MLLVEVEKYTFEELSDFSQENAIENLQDINVDHNWWDQDGLLDMTATEMKSRHIDAEYEKTREWWGKCLFSYGDIYFDIERDNYLQFESITILEIHTYYLSIPDVNVTEREQVIIDRAIEIFAVKVDEALSMLRNDYDYLAGKEAIIEAIKANDYTFDVDGNLI